MTQRHIEILMILLRINLYLNSALQCSRSSVISGLRCQAAGPRHIEAASKHQRGNFLADQTATTAERNPWKEEPRIMWQWRYAKPSASRKNKNVSTRIKQKHAWGERNLISHNIRGICIPRILFAEPWGGGGWGEDRSEQKLNMLSFFRKHHRGGFHILHISFYFALRHPSELWMLFC